MTYKEALEKLRGMSAQERARFLENSKNRAAILSSGANVNIYAGELIKGETLKEAFSKVFIGLIQRKNRFGKLDGLGALGGLVERTSTEELLDKKQISPKEVHQKILAKLFNQKDDIIYNAITKKYEITTDINIIRINNVLREMKEELADLGIEGISINPDKLELISMPEVKDDNYIINIWNGEGNSYAVNPYSHLYKDETGLLDILVEKAKERENGEATKFIKKPLFDALSAYGNKPTGNEPILEDGRVANKDYRYTHEYLAAWALASNLLNHDPKKLLQLAIEVQKEADHHISFKVIAKATNQSLSALAKVLGVDEKTIQDIETKTKEIFKKASC